MKNRASWRHASFFIYLFIFSPSFTLVVKIFTHLQTLQHEKCPAYGLIRAWGITAVSIRKEGSYFHPDTTHLSDFPQGRSIVTLLQKLSLT